MSGPTQSFNTRSLASVTTALGRICRELFIQQHLTRLANNLEPGEHTVTACDRNTGREVMTRMSVESL
jgi:hypothetical protein